MSAIKALSVLAVAGALCTYAEASTTPEDPEVEQPDEPEDPEEEDDDTDDEADRAFSSIEWDDDEVEIESRGVRDGVTSVLKFELENEDKGLEFSVKYERGDDDEGGVEAKTKFEVQELWAFKDLNGNGLLDEDEEAAAARYKLGKHWAPFTCTEGTIVDQNTNVEVSSFSCNACNSADETRITSEGVVCFVMSGSVRPVTQMDRTIDPRSVKIDMNWDASNYDWGENDSLALVAKFKSESTFDPVTEINDPLATPEREDGVLNARGNGVRWERRVFDQFMNNTVGDVKYGPAPKAWRDENQSSSGDGGDDGDDSDSEEEDDDGEILITKVKQIAFSVAAADSFKWDPVVTNFPGSAASVAPAMFVVGAAVIGVVASL